MKLHYSIHILALSFYSLIFNSEAQAQEIVCDFKNQIYQLDFGTASNEKIFNLASLRNYKRTENQCPEDGYYGYLTSIGDCFEDKWHKLGEDHTPGDKEGKMLVVNASFTPGPFFVFKLAGLKPGTVYEWSAWVINICKSAEGCIPTPPVLRITVGSGTNNIAKFQTAQLVTKTNPVWLKQSGIFIVPDGVTEISVYMEDITEGGCGNDFALDDFVLKECSNQQVTIPEAMSPKSSGKSKPPAEKQAYVKPDTDKKSEIKSPDSLNNLISKTQAKNETPISQKPASIETNPQSIPTPVPKPLINRSNPVVKQIETDETEMTIQLFDNGQIDGDTVSIFHNNMQVVSRAGLSTTPITVKIKVDKQQPHHELVMVAENLGSIPPNTSLMIITTKNNRYEIFITSTEQKNAKIVIDLAEK